MIGGIFGVQVNGTPDTLPVVADVPYIYAVIQKLCPEPRWTIHTLRRYLHDLSADSSLVMTRARRGEGYIRNNFLPTMKNDITRPNQRWQIDARPLPIYIMYDGMICTVTLLQILDDYAWYPVRHRIIPRKVRDDEGLPTGADFTSGDVGMLLASAMYYEGIRPEDLYTDNGSQIIAIEVFLDDLTDENETLIRMRNSIPGRPRGRGKIEKFLGLIDELLKDLPANFVGKEKDLMAVRAARGAKNMLTFETLCDLLDEYLDHVRTTPRNKREKTSRDVIWRRAPALAAPPIRRLKVLTPHRFEGLVAITNWKITFNKEEYEPRVQDADAMYRWLLAASRPDYVPLHAAKLDAGWVLEVCLDGQHWDPCIRKTERSLSDSQYNALQNAVLTRIRVEQQELFSHVQAQVQEAGADRIQKHVITKQPMFLEELPADKASVAAQDEQHPDNTAPPVLRPVHGRSPSLKPAKRGKKEVSATKSTSSGDWGNTLDMDEIMRKLEQEIIKEQEQ